MGSLRWQGISPTAAAVALYLGRHPDMKTSELAEAFGVKPPTMRTHLRLLELGGFVQRTGQHVRLAVALEQLTERWGDGYGDD